MAKANARLADREWLVRRYRHDEAPVATIAAEAGADASSVHRWLTRHGIELRGAAGRRTLAHLGDKTVKDAVRKGATLSDASQALGVDVRTLTDRLARMGMHAHVGGTEGADEMAEQYAGGASLDEIADQHGVSRRTVQRRLAAAGTEMRPAGRPTQRSAS